MSALDIWVYAKNGKLFRRTENDGWTFLRSGPDAHDDEIIGIAAPYWVHLASGAVGSIRFESDWAMITKHFGKANG